jgi:hypothetical protein
MSDLSDKIADAIERGITGRKYGWNVTAYPNKGRVALALGTSGEYEDEIAVFLTCPDVDDLILALEEARKNVFNR